MDREQMNILQNYTTAIRVRLRELDSYKSTEDSLTGLRQIESLAKNAGEKIECLDKQLTLSLGG